jgi:hypothetical protein
MKRIYVAGPMTGYQNLNFPAFHAETARLRGLGYDVVNPAEINGDPTACWKACMRADIAQLVTCDAVATLPGWARSRGASMEVGIAHGLEMAVVSAASILAGPERAPVLIPSQQVEMEDACAAHQMLELKVRGEVA